MDRLMGSSWLEVGQGTTGVLRTLKEGDLKTGREPNFS